MSFVLFLEYLKQNVAVAGMFHYMKPTYDILLSLRWRESPVFKALVDEMGEKEAKRRKYI